MKKKVKQMADITSTYYYHMNKLKNSVREDEYDMVSKPTIHYLKDLLNKLEYQKGFSIKHLAILQTFERLSRQIVDETESEDINTDYSKEDEESLFDEMGFPKMEKLNTAFGLNQRLSLFN